MTASTVKKSSVPGAPRKSLEPWIKDEVQYYPHQTEAIRSLARQRGFLLGDEMGLGKSLQAITVFAIDIALNKSETCIVICPATLKGNWLDEFEKFSGIPAIMLNGPKAERYRQLKEYDETSGPRVLITNYEQMLVHLEDFNKLGFDIAIFDEAHYLKNPKAKRTKACLALKSTRNFMLTGTPMLNKPDELWALLHKIDPHEPRLKKYWSFVNRYCNTPDAPIWMADGSFKPIGDIQVGDEVVGWTRAPGGRKRRVASKVKAISRRIAPEVIRVTLESGSVIKCTPDHKWLTTSHGSSVDVFNHIGPPIGNGRTGNLRVLSKVIEPTPKLNAEQQRAFDWLAGIYDGEGSRNFIAQSMSFNPEIYTQAMKALTTLGIPHGLHKDGIRLKGGLQTFVNIANWSRDSLMVKRDFFQSKVLAGGRYQTKSGTISQPGRTEAESGQLNRYPDQIVKIESLGPGEVVSMETETGNYIAWGYASKNCAQGGYTGREVVGVKNQKELNDLLNRYMTRRLKKDVLDLPEVQIIERRVDLLPEQKKLYNEVLNELQLTLPDEPNPMQIENALTKLLRLKQIVGTTLPFTGEDHSAKLDLALEDDLEIIKNDHRIVVFTQFRAVQEAYKKRLEDAGIPVWILNGDVPIADRQGIVKDWSSSREVGVILCMLQVAGVGLNMTAASYGSFLDKLYVPGLNRQAIDRLHRIGASSSHPVQIREYKARGTIDTRIDEILRGKSNLIDGTIDNNDEGWKQKLVAKLLAKGVV